MNVNEYWSIMVSIDEYYSRLSHTLQDIYHLQPCVEEQWSVHAILRSSRDLQIPFEKIGGFPRVRDPAVVTVGFNTKLLHGNISLMTFSSDLRIPSGHLLQTICTVRQQPGVHPIGSNNLVMAKLLLCHIPKIPKWCLDCFPLETCSHDLLWPKGLGEPDRDATGPPKNTA